MIFVTVLRARHARWCVFELAAYHKLNPSGRITIAPVFVEVSVCLLFAYLHVASWFFMALRTSAIGQTGWIWMVLACFACSLFPLVHAMRHICMYKQALLSSLGSFSFETLACANESDRLIIREAIVRWYGSVEAFSEFVRGPFRKVVHDSVRTPGGMPFGNLAANGLDLGPLIFCSPGIMIQACTLNATGVFQSAQDMFF